MRLLDYALVLVLLFGSAWFSFRGLEARKSVKHLPMAFEQKAPENLDRFSLIAALGGMRRVAADWTYVEQLQYIGDEVWMEREGFASYHKFGEEILWLDPYFNHAIQETGMVIGFTLEGPNSAISFLRKAAVIDPSYDRYQDMIGALLFEMDSKPNEAIELLQKDILSGRASETLMRIVGNIYLKYEDWEGARQYWEWACPRMTRPKSREACRRVYARLKEKGL